MAPRAYWKGYLKLSLVSCPIALSPATSASERISFRQINKKTGNRLRQQLVDEETREPVEAADKGKGYEVDKGVYIEVEDDELEAIEVESKHTIEIDRFVPAAQIDKRFYDSPYYVMPTDTVGQEAFAVIRDAMRGKGMVALGRIVLAKRERVIALEPYGKGLLGTMLRYGYEVRKPEEYFDGIEDIKVPGEMLKLAEHILNHQGRFRAGRFEDLETTLMKLLRKKQAGCKPRRARSTSSRLTTSSISWTRCVAASRPSAARRRRRARRAASGSKAARMLLPIEGGERAPRRAAAKKTGTRRKAG